MDNPAETSAATKPSLLDGLLSRDRLKSETGWGWRTILRREADGLPVIVIGGTKLYPANEVRTWIMSQLRHHALPKRGRPKGAR